MRSEVILFFIIFADVNCSPEKASSEKTHECPKNSQCIDIKGFGNHTEAKNASNKSEGLCGCKPEFMVNKKFIPTDNSSVYCIEREIAHSTSSLPPPSTQSTPSSTKAPVVTTTNPTTTTIKPSSTAVPPVDKSTSAPVPPKKDNSTEKQNASNNPAISPVPEPKRSLFATLLVPVMIVLAFIGAIFAVRRFNVVDRAHTYIRNRRGQQHQVCQFINLFGDDLACLILKLQTRYDGLENDFDDDPLLI